MEAPKDLLIEIGTEELPPTALQHLSEAFENELGNKLDQNRLRYSRIDRYATPRRLALLVVGLSTRQPDQEIVRKGPAIRAAYDSDGKPSKAALGFAKSCGVGLSDLLQEETPKGAWLVFRQKQEGRGTTGLLIEIVRLSLAALPIPKRMRWGSRDDEFVRPVHWVCLLFGKEEVAGSIFGVECGTTTRGHRFHSPEAIRVSLPSEYPELLRVQGRVEASFSRRKGMIRRQVEDLAKTVSGEAVLDEDLLDEVTALCEWPTAVMGTFDEAFLEIPPEVLIETMQKHQKYFPLFSADKQLMPWFITISNIDSKDPSQVREGNERVIRPRFSDAAFFWNQDQKRPLEAFAPRLKAVVFQKELGTLSERSSRVAQISRHIAASLGLDEELAARSAYLAKCDLMTKMIFEFPSLQGLMGRYYAEKSGEEPCVSSAIEEQYLPRHAGDRLPKTDCGRVLSIADKLDSLVGIFAIGQRPTGVKDPYALRRASIGVLRILIETPLSLDLKELLEFTAGELRDKVDAKEAATEVFDYSMDRLKAYYQQQGTGSDVVDAVLSVGVTIPCDIDLRIKAVDTFRHLREAEALTAANKRIRNILRKSGKMALGGITPRHLREVAEKQLASEVSALELEISPLLVSRDYAGVLKILSRLRDDVDAFFDQVMVMTEEKELRRNRLALLRAVESLFQRVGDLSRLH